MNIPEGCRAVEGGVTAAAGFMAGGIHCGIKRDPGTLDLGLLRAVRRSSVAGVFTTNRAAAAPVLLCRERVAGGYAGALVVNSGSANACTGAQGRADATRMGDLAAERCDVPAGETLVLSTGVIGVLLPMDRVARGIAACALEPDGGDAFARAIMTTDTRSKQFALRCAGDMGEFTVGGAAKGSGMIHPNMATLLAFITSDATVAPDFLQSVLRRAADRSFNLISVDGDTSTNDSLIALANGAADGTQIDARHPDSVLFEAALTWVAVALAREVVRDGEGARTLITFNVHGAPDEKAARAVASTISRSSLVKSAVFGGDPNWGRVISSAGNAGVDFDADQASLWLNETCLFRRGQPQPFDRQEAAAQLQAPEVTFTLDLAQGDAIATAWGCDLSYEYVRINAEYTT